MAASPFETGVGGLGPPYPHAQRVGAIFPLLPTTFSRSDGSARGRASLLAVDPPDDAGLSLPQAEVCAGVVTTPLRREDWLALIDDNHC